MQDLREFLDEQLSSFYAEALAVEAGAAGARSDSAVEMAAAGASPPEGSLQRSVLESIVGRSEGLFLYELFF